ncbi:hypothetical protein [Streptomyces sp. NPDC001985]
MIPQPADPTRPPTPNDGTATSAGLPVFDREARKYRNTVERRISKL